jgi:hypothetical protein
VCFSRFLSLLSSSSTSCPTCPIFFNMVLLMVVSEAETAGELCSVGATVAGGDVATVGLAVGSA